ncbi:penicillin-binding protein 2 [Frateuria aurantia]
MRIRSDIKDARGESAMFQRRALTGFALIVLGLCGLVARYVYLQVDQHDEYALRSTQNRIKQRALPPGRGLIYDRNGLLLADNVPAFRLEVVPEQVHDMKASLDALAEIVPLSAEDRDNFHKQLRLNRRFDSIPLKMHLNEDEIARFAVNQWRFPGMEVVPYQIRRYPMGDLYAHVVGYVSRISERDQAQLDPAVYKGTTHIGRTGVERAYESQLHGTPGYDLVEVNADGKVQRVLEHHPATAGRNLYLSIDTRLQKAAVAAFAGRPGAAVAIDPRNGQVLALVSVPSYDPNLFINGISEAAYRELTTAPNTPLLNRAIQSAYPPGSTVKPLLGLGGLEMGLRRPQDTVLSTGEFFIPGQSRAYRDDVRGGVGVVNLMQAIEKSVNTYFYKLALDMGIDRLSQFMGSFGFGRPTGVDLYGERGGILPSRAWKRQRFHQAWFPGDTVNAGIGQGYWGVTPIQLSHAFATFADQGTAYAPRLAVATEQPGGGGREEIPNPPLGPSLISNHSNWQAVDTGMEMVIYGNGTGRGLGNGFPYRIAGKSGTAERFSRTTDAYDTNRNKAYLAARHRAWFVAYTPADQPRIVVAALLEAGAWGGSDAGPIVRKIFDAWLAEQKDAPAGAPPPPDVTPASATTQAGTL